MSKKKPAAAEKPATDVEAAKQPGGKKKLIMLAAPLLLAGVLGGLWFTGILPGMLGMGHDKKAAAGATEATAADAAPIFVDMPEVIANLDAGPRRASYVKMTPKLQITRAADRAVILSNMPRLQDLFTTYLREMRPEELRGSTGTYRLREELITRANIAASPAKIVDVLFTEMIVQ